MSKSSTDRALIDYLAQFVTENKRSRIREVLAERTRWMTIVLEDIYMPQNASAALRTSELMGLQDVYIVENRNAFEVNREVVKGSTKWLNLHQFNEEDVFNTPNCLAHLREKGYKMAAASPHHGGSGPEDLPVDQPLAIWFGTEETGLTDAAIDAADYHMQLPMYGFTESYNLSVSVAMTLAAYLPQLRMSSAPWPLTEDERAALTLDWYRKIVDRSEIIEREYYKRGGH
jgi:tRNA (guanosine-2'-O-)-methyltransferase